MRKNMKLDEYRIMYEAEESFWWYRGMWSITKAMIEKFYKPGGGIHILDAGCGTGGVMSGLPPYGTAFGMDILPFALGLSRKRGLTRLACGSVTSLPFPSDRFDLAISLDVFVMLKPAEETAALREIRRVLAPGGRLLLRMAAYDWFRSRHDRAWDVEHRYAKNELREKLEKSGFIAEHMSYANLWLLPAAIVKRTTENILPPQENSDTSLGIGFLNKTAERILSSEAKWIARRGLPAGLSLYAMARKKD